MNGFCDLVFPAEAEISDNTAITKMEINKIKMSKVAS